jgi:hypothetical protein
MCLRRFNNLVLHLVVPTVELGRGSDQIVRQ